MSLTVDDAIRLLTQIRSASGSIPVTAHTETSSAAVLHPAVQRALQTAERPVVPYVSYGDIIETLAGGREAGLVVPHIGRLAISVNGGLTSVATQQTNVTPEHTIVLYESTLTAYTYSPNFTVSVSADGEEPFLSEVEMINSLDLPGAFWPHFKTQMTYTVANGDSSINTLYVSQIGVQVVDSFYKETLVPLFTMQRDLLKSLVSKG